METIRYFTTKDLSLAAALLAIGIPFERRPHRVKTETGTVYTFFFAPKSADGTYKTNDLVAAWASEDWQESNLEHPFAYIKCAFKNRDYLLDHMKQFKRYCMVESKGRQIMIPEDADEKEVERLFAL